MSLGPWSTRGPPRCEAELEALREGTGERKSEFAAAQAEMALAARGLGMRICEG